MKYVSVDVETSGLDDEKNCILSIGAIIEDTKTKLPYEQLPKFHAIVLQNEITGHPRAISMNKGIIQIMSEYLEGTKEVRALLDERSGYKFYDKDEVIKHFFDFLFINGYQYELPGAVRVVDGRALPILCSNTKSITINVAGKNFGTFDKLFLEELMWWKKLIRVRQRIIDPAGLYCDWINDETLPNLDECKKRANIDGAVTHDALQDAWDVIKVLRNKY